MEYINLENSIHLIKSFFQINKIWNFLNSDPNLYIGGSLPFMCLSEKITDITELKLGDIDIYTKNCPLLFRNLNKTFTMTDVIKTGVNVKFNIECTQIPIQIITSPFDNFENEVLDEYDCGMIAVGFHPYSSKFIIHKKFLSQLKKKQFEVIHEKTNPSRVKKLLTRAKELFDAELIEITFDTYTDYRPYWKNKIEINCIGDLMPSPPYTQLYVNKYHCIGCGEKQDFLICKVCQCRISNNFIQTIKSNNFVNKYKKVVVFGGVNGLGRIIADEIIEIGDNLIQVSRTSRNQKCIKNIFTFDLEKYSIKYEQNIKISNNYRNCVNLINNKQIINSELMEKILEADLIIFNAYQTLEGDQTIWNTNLNTFDPELSEKRFKINCWGYVGLLQEILEARKLYISNKSINTYIQDQIFVWIDANESRFEGKLSDGKHLELNMAKTACKQIFYTNANIMAGLGILFLCYDCGWCSFHGISVDKIASKSKYLVSPKLSAQALISYISNIDIDKLYNEKKYIHDMTFYKCVADINIDFNSKFSSEEFEEIIYGEIINYKKNNKYESKKKNDEKFI